MAAPIFVGYLWIMQKLPSSHGDVPACFVGAAFTPLNVVFSLSLSLMMAFMIDGLIRLYKKRARSARGVAGGVLGVFGFVFGFFTVFCAVCTIPVVSVFGFAVGLGFFTAYEGIFKALSISMMAFALWLLHRQLNDDCGCD